MTQLMKRCGTSVISVVAMCALAGIAQGSLILHYPIDSTSVVAGAPDVLDQTAIQVNHGYRSGGGDFTLTTDRNGTANEAVIFTGNQGIAIDNTNGVATSSGEFTIAGWYKGTDTGYFFDQNSNRLVLSVERNSNQDPNDGGAPAGLGVHYNSGSGIWYNSGVTTANDDKWHHLAFVLDNDTTDSFFSIYLDGVAVDVDPAAPGVQLTRTMTGQGIANLTQQGTNFRQRFGSNRDGSADGLAGHYDDLRIYNTALTAGEIQQLAGVVIPEPMTMLAVGLGIAGLGGYVRKRRRR